jgi:hypothetical protein
MPTPRKYESNAARQRAYRARQKAKRAEDGKTVLTKRIIDADARARASE